MKRIHRIILLVGVLLLGFVILTSQTVDIRNDYLRSELQEEDYAKGRAMLQEMEDAYGGKENYLAYQQATFIQKADWYGRKRISNWDTVPQRFQMVSYPHSEDCELTLLNGPNTGLKWGLADGKSYTIQEGQARQYAQNDHQKDKLIFKNYWFQFPFRVGEAEIVSYAGKAEVAGKSYDLVYATWGSEAANGDYDQFLLYLDPETRMIAYLHFTVRDKFKVLSMTAKFDNFKTVDQLTLPHSQYVTFGKPPSRKIKAHENHYEEIRFSD